MNSKKLISFIVLFTFLFTAVGQNYLFAFPGVERKYCLRVPCGFPESEKEIEGIKKAVTEKVKELSGALKKIYGEETGIDNIKFVKEEGKYWFVRVNVYGNLLTINTASSQIPFPNISKLINKIFFREFAEKFIYGKFGYNIAHYPFLKLDNISTKIDNEHFFIPAFATEIDRYIRLGIFKKEDLMAGLGDVVSEKIARGLFVKHNYGTSDDFIGENELYQRILVGQGKQIRDEIKDKFLIDLAVKIAVLNEQREIAKASVLKSSIQETIANLKNLADKIYQQKDKKVEPLKEKLLDLLRIMEEKNRMQSFDDFKKKLGENEFNNNELNNEFMRLAGIIEKKKPELFPETVYYTRKIIFNQLVSDFQELYARTELKVKPLITTRKIKLKSGIKLAYRSLERPDAKENVVFIHGLGGSKEYWLETMEDYYRAGYNVYALDLTGYGQSSKPGKPYKYSFEKYADGLNEFMERLRIDKAMINGHSLGGNVALEFSYRYEEKVAELKLTGTTITPEPKKSWEDVQDVFKFPLNLIVKLFLYLSYLPLIKHGVSYLVLKIKPDLFNKYFETSRISREKLAIFVRGLLKLQKYPTRECFKQLEQNDIVHYKDILTKLKESGIPFPFIYGSEEIPEDITVRETIRELKALGIKPIILPGVKHCPMITQPRKLSQALGLPDAIENSVVQEKGLPKVSKDGNWSKGRIKQLLHSL